MCASRFFPFASIHPIMKFKAALLHSHLKIKKLNQWRFSRIFFCLLILSIFKHLYTRNKESLRHFRFYEVDPTIFILNTIKYLDIRNLFKSNEHVRNLTLYNIASRVASFLSRCELLRRYRRSYIILFLLNKKKLNYFYMAILNSLIIFLNKLKSTNYTLMYSFNR